MDIPWDVSLNLDLLLNCPLQTGGFFILFRFLILNFVCY